MLVIMLQYIQCYRSWEWSNSQCYIPFSFTSSITPLSVYSRNVSVYCSHAGARGGGHCIGDCTPTRDCGQSEVKRSRRNFEAGQAVKLGIGGSLRTVKVSPGDQWAWLMLDSQGSRPDFRCGQGVKHENLLGQDLDRGRGWKYRRLCSVPPLWCTQSTTELGHYTGIFRSTLNLN